MINLKFDMGSSASALASAVLAAALVGCGGGSTSSPLENSTVSNDVSVGNKSITAGQTTAIRAHAVMRGDSPSRMAWAMTPLFTTSPTDALPLIGDLNCSTAALVPSGGTSTGGVALSGEGLCSTVLTIPPNAKSGTWRLTNVASGNQSSATGYADITITALPASGFQLVESSVPVNGYVNKPLSMNVPFSVDPGMAVENVKYTWTADTANPAVVAIAGASTSSATVVPVTSGQYKFYVTASAEVNGYVESATGSVVAIVYPPTFTDVIDAGLPQRVAYDQTVSLSGSILNKDNSLNYQTSWKQLDGVAGGPAVVSLGNANSSTASFVAPRMAGTYGFEYKVVKHQSDGSQMITTATTFVIVGLAPTGVFTVSAGDAQNVQRGAVAFLRGGVGTQGSSTGVTYTYKWTQVSGPTVTISNDTNVTATIVPTTNGVYVFQFQVTATSSSGVGAVITSRTQVIVSDDGTGVTPPAASVNYALSANAGNAQTSAPHTVATLSGAYAAQGDATGVTYTYQWSQIGSGPSAVVLSNPNTPIATFIPTVSGTYGFRLTVTATLANGTTRTATADTLVLVGTTGSAFSVNAGNAQAVAVNTATSMAGTVSTQGSHSGAIFTYEWTQVGASPATVTISNKNSLTASFIPTIAGTYSFQLSVTSNQGGLIQTRTAQTQVLVSP